MKVSNLYYMKLELLVLGFSQLEAQLVYLAKKLQIYFEIGNLMRSSR